MTSTTASAAVSARTAHTIRVRVREARTKWTIFTPPPGDEGLYTGIMTGPDDAMWLTDASGRLVRVDTSGGRTAVPLRFSSNGTYHRFLPGYAALGKDGRFYMTGCVDSAASCAFIGVADTSGILQVYSIPSGSSARFSGLALGPDGNVWFTDSTGVAKISSSGSIKEFTYRSGEYTNQLSGVAAGPDGKMWFTEVDKLTVGSVDPMTGKMVEYSTVSQNIDCGLSGMAAGADGNLYAACGEGVVQVVTDGTMSYFGALQGLSDGAQEIAVGGTFLWFEFLNQVGRFDPAQSELVLYQPPDGAVTLYGSATGPDAKQWIVSESGTVYVVSPPSDNRGKVR